MTCPGWPDRIEVISRTVMAAAALVVAFAVAAPLGWLHGHSSVDSATEGHPWDGR